MHSPLADRSIVRRNFVLNVLDGSLFSFGINLVSRTTVLPVLVTRIGGDNVAVALIIVLWTLGFYFPQIFIANVAQQTARKKRLLLRTALGQRLPWLLLAVLAYVLLGHVGTEVGLVLFFMGFGLAAITGSLNLPVWFDLLAKITPVNLRGRLFAMRAIVGGLLGVLAGGIAEYVLERMAYPNSFALLFTIAFGVMMVSYVFLSLLKEGPADEAPRRVRYREFLRSLPDILRRERNYRNYLIADAMLMTATLADAFYTVNAFSRFQLSAGYAGRFTMIFMGATVVSSLLFGYLADRFGHRINLMICAASTACACIVALTAPTVYAYYFVFVGAAFATNLLLISRLPFLAEVCGEKDRPTYVALASMLTSPFVLLGLAAGWVANQAGYAPVFMAVGLVAVCAAIWLLLMVREPRRAQAEAVRAVPVIKRWRG